MDDSIENRNEPLDFIREMVEDDKKTTSSSGRTSPPAGSSPG